MSKLSDFLTQVGSLDVESDEKMINRLISDSNRKRLERMAKNVSGNHSLTLNMGLFRGSYATKSKHSIMINIDPMIAYDPKDTFEKLWVKCQGMVAHEAGHIAYSDYDVISENKKRELYAQAMIPEIGKKILDENFDENSKEGQEILDGLRKTIYDYIYYKNLADMLNSIEDGGVEHMVPSYAPRTQGGIVAMRNHIYEMEMKSLSEAYKNYKSEDRDEMGYFISEMRQYAVIGYRKDLHPIFLPDVLTPEQIEEVELLGLYGRIGVSKTEERNAISEVLLDMLKPIMDKKTDRFMKEYISTLFIDPAKAAAALDEEINKHCEMVCQGAMDPSLAGSTKPHNITSDYQMDLPQQTMDKINEKLKERHEQKEQESNNNSGGQGQSDNSSQQNSNSSGESGENGESENNSEDGTNGNGEENDENSGEGSGDSDSEGEGEDGDSENEGKGSGDGDESNDEANSSESDSASEEGGNGNPDSGLSKNSDGKTASSAKKTPLDKKSAAMEADSAYKDSLRNAEKSFEKENATEFKQSLGDGNGIAPKLENGMGDPNSISDCHKGIKTKYYPSSKLKAISSAGNEVKTMEGELNKIVAKFSKKLKEVLMYQAKTRRKMGLKNGQIHDASLSRIITDQRVFKKTIQGIEKKARIAVLIDLSGSMYGEKEKDAIAAAYMLADSCARIKVPISVMGHNTGGSYINLYHFVEYEKCINRDAKEKILCAQAGGANHDGLAIFHAATDLVRHRKPGEQLVLLVISDGAPAGIDGYWGDIADKDIQKITGAFEKQYNVKTIGIGIGGDVEHIPNIYKNFLIVPNVEKLGDELLKVLKSLLM